MSKKIPTPKELLEAKCPNAYSSMIRFGSRSQVNFKCASKVCNGKIEDSHVH